MKKNIFLITVTLTAALASCKKENNDSLPIPTSLENKIKTVASNGGVSTHKYDAAGRKTEVVYGNGDKTAYEYGNAVVFEKEYDNAGVLQRSYKFELNGQGLVAKETQDGDPDFSRIYIYNSDKQILKRIANDNGNAAVSDYFYSNGNCDSTRMTYNNVWNYTEKFTYHTDKPNALGNQQFGTTFYGEKSKNLTKTQVNHFPDGSTTTPETGAFEFDSKGRIVKSTHTQGANIYIQLYTY